MRTLLKTIFLLTLTFPIVVFGQSGSDAERVVEKLENDFRSESSRFHFDLRSLDSLTLIVFLAHADSIAHYPFDAIFGKLKRKNEKFIADNREPWRPGDFVTKENKSLPERRFLFGWTTANSTAIFYWHGGIGTHIHVVLVDMSTRTLSSFVTLNNSKLIRKLDNGHRLSEIRDQKLQRFVDTDDLKYWDNKFVHKGDEDVF